MHSGIPSECQTVWIQIMDPNGLQRLSADGQARKEFTGGPRAFQIGKISVENP